MTPHVPAAPTPGRPRGRTVRPAPRTGRGTRRRARPRRGRLRTSLELGALLLVLAFAASMALIPHLSTFNDPTHPLRPGMTDLAGATIDYLAGDRSGYRHTVHVDENMHWVRIANIERHQTIIADEPYTGAPADRTTFFSLRGAVHETGFHVLFVQFHLMTGIPYPTILQWGPAVWGAVTAFIMYAAIRPHPAALPAAAFTALVPTTVRFLGPAFLVPIGFVLAWLPGILILAPHARRRFAAVVLLILAALSGTARDRRAMFILLTIALLPILWLYHAFTSDVGTEATREEFLPIDFGIFLLFGLLALFLWGVGVLLYETSPTRRQSPILTALVEGGVLFILLISLSVALDLNRYATYARWHPPFFLCAAAALGTLVARLAQSVADTVGAITERATRQRTPTHGIAIALAVLLTLGILSPGVQAQQREPYYHVLSDRDWETYQWIADNVGPEYEVFLTHPWKAPVLTAITGKHPHAWLNPGSPPVRGADWDRYLQGRHDLAFYVTHDITLVVGPRNPHPDLYHQAAPNVWLMDAAVAAALHEARLLERGAAR